VTERKKIGDILVEAGLISATTLERALTRQKETSRRIGEVLQDMGVITEKELAEGLATQYGFRSSSGFANVSFDKALLALVPEDIAISRLVFPLKKNETTLAVAMDDPWDRETLDLLARKTGLTIMPVLAPLSEIREAVKRNYMGVEITVSSGRKKILVIEDSPSMVTVLRNTLEEEGYQVTVAQDGMEGLKKAMSELPDLIITDAIMPKMDGMTLMKMLRNAPATATIPVILLTSQSAAEAEKKAFEAGFIDYIIKPAPPLRVATRVKRAFQMMENMGTPPRRP
jgi:PleD family two-component response regulator